LFWGKKKNEACGPIFHLAKTFIKNILKGREGNLGGGKSRRFNCLHQKNGKSRNRKNGNGSTKQQGHISIKPPKKGEKHLYSRQRVKKRLYQGRVTQQEHINPWVGGKKASFPPSRGEATRRTPQNDSQGTACLRKKWEKKEGEI